jgi:thioredoxin-related protein
MSLLKTSTCSALLFYLASILPQLVLAAPPEQYSFLPLTQAFEQAVAKNKPIFLYFGRYGCSICLKMHKEVFTDPALRQKMSEQFVLAYVDIESGNRIRLPNGERTTEMQFASRNRLVGTPTFIYFSANQEPLFKKSGFQTVSRMLQYNEYVSEEHYRTMNLKKYLSMQ